VELASLDQQASLVEQVTRVIQDLLVLLAVLDSQEHLVQPARLELPVQEALLEIPAHLVAQEPRALLDHLEARVQLE